MNKQLAAYFKTNSSGSSTGTDTECLSSHFALKKNKLQKKFSQIAFTNRFVCLLSLHCGNTNNELKKFDDLIPSNNRCKILFNCSLIFSPFFLFLPFYSRFSSFFKINKDTFPCAAVILQDGGSERP